LDFLVLKGLKGYEKKSYDPRFGLLNLTIVFRTLNKSAVEAINA